jgi:hypothetical protein
MVKTTFLLLLIIVIGFWSMTMSMQGKLEPLLNKQTLKTCFISLGGTCPDLLPKMNYSK